MPDTLSAAFRFVLVEPRFAGNIGSAARVLKNFGFGRLDIVSPRGGPIEDEAFRMAVGASDVLRAAREHASLDQALAGAAVIVGTSRRMGKQRQPHFGLEEIAAESCRLVPRGEVAFVFGREDRGLSDADLDRCTHLAYIPANPDYPSLNLAQAVGVTVYALRRALEATHPVSTGDGAGEGLADHTAREAMFAHLEESLLAIGFLKDGQIEGMMRRMRRILGRAELSAGDVDVLRGIARQTLWIAGRAHVDPPKRP